MKLSSILAALCLLFGLSLCGFFLCKSDLECYVFHNPSSAKDVVSIFPKSVGEVEKILEAAKREASECIDGLVSIPASERTFLNTAKAADGAYFGVRSASGILEIVKLVSPEEEVRKAASDAHVELGKFCTKLLVNNESLYKAFKEYVGGKMKEENLASTEVYYINEKMKGFKHEGLTLPAETQEKVVALKGEIAELNSKFEKAISDDNRCLSLPIEDLSGLDSDFIGSLKRNEDGSYVIGVDYPTYDKVMRNCTNCETRRKLYLEFQNRAYPVNKPVLEKIIEKQEELAKLLGFETFSHMDIDSQMAKTPEKVAEFLNSLVDRSKAKAVKEFQFLTEHCPDGIAKSDDGKFFPWDLGYVLNDVSKKQFGVDVDLVAEYFPTEKAIAGVFATYENFFNIAFKEICDVELWDPDAKLFEITSKDRGEVLGYTIFDLYPRDGKYTHACACPSIPSIIAADGKRLPGLAVMVANFTKPMGAKPALMKFKEVETFFHELGHILHELCGATRLVEFSGISVEADFVEAPSQMAEELASDRAVMKRLSSHYSTKETLPDDLIEKILGSEKFGCGIATARQLMLTKFSLECFSGLQKVDLDGLCKKLYDQMIDGIVFYPETHFYASFGHLANGLYASKYYVYLWSKVIALDFFDHIKKLGGICPEAGKEYRTKVLEKGGSLPADEIARGFLGRDFNSEAFMKKLFQE